MTLDEAILRILDDRAFDDQADLLACLRSGGYDLTLSTLSRHLKKLQVRKEGGRYQRMASRQGNHPAFTLRKVPPSLLILKTAPGFAQALALALDGAQLPSLAGTVAGDDTIFAAAGDPSQLEDLETEIRDFMEA